MTAREVSMENLNIYSIHGKELNLDRWSVESNLDISKSLFDIFKNVAEHHAGSSETLSKIDLATFQKKDINKFSLKAPDSYEEITEAKKEKKLALILSIVAITILAAGILVAVFGGIPELAIAALMVGILGHLFTCNLLIPYVFDLLPKIPCRRYPQVETVVNVSIGMLAMFSIGPFLALIKAATSKIPNAQELETEKEKVVEQHKEIQTYLDNLFACYQFLQQNPNVLRTILFQNQNSWEISRNLTNLGELFDLPLPKNSSNPSRSVTVTQKPSHRRTKSLPRAILTPGVASHTALL